MPIYYKIAQLVVNPERASSLSRVHISQPDVSQEETVGRLLILAEFPAKKSDYQALFNLIIEQISIAYYENEQILLLNKLATVTVATIFESAVSKINQILFDIYQNQTIKFANEELSITIAVIHENKIHFTSIGRNQALLIYKPKAQAGVSDESFSLINISKKTSDSKEDIFAPNKILANVVSGQIPQNGFFLFTNEALHEYLSEKQLIKIVSSLPPASAAAQIENLLKQTQLAVPFSLLIIKNHKGQQSNDDSPVVSSYSSPELRSISTHRTHMPSGPEKDLNKESIRVLNMTEDKTAAILKPSGFFSYRKLFIGLGAAAGKLKPKTKSNLRILPAKTFDRKQSFISLAKISGFLLTVALSLWTVLRALLSHVTDQDKRQRLVTNLKLIKSRITKTHLIMISVVIICLGLFFANAYRLKQQSQLAQMHEAVAELIKAIEKEETQIEADLLYGNKDKARNSLNQIGAMLRDFPNQMNEQEKTEFNIKKTNYENQLAKINNIIRLSNLEAEVNGKEGHLNNLVSIGDYLYLTVDNKIVKVDKKTKSFKTISDVDSNLKFGSTDKSGAYWLLSGNQILQITPADNLKRLALDEAPDNIKGFEIYYNKLYLYTDTNKQVYRYQLTQDGFRDKTEWLKNNEGLGSIRSLSIDGFVYLLDENSVHQFGSGRPQNFSLSPVEPPLSNPTKIIALKDNDYLYVLEPSQKRLIVYNKKGVFINQYTGDQLGDLSDMAVDESYQTLYLLSGTTVYKTKLLMPTLNK